MQMTIDGAGAPSVARSTVIDPFVEAPIATYKEADAVLERAAGAAAFRGLPGQVLAGAAGDHGAFRRSPGGGRMDVSVIMACESGGAAGFPGLRASAPPETDKQGVQWARTDVRRRERPL